jgi:tetratricopeptide (TPR) repeat protein
MKKTTFVAILILTSNCFAGNFENSLQRIEAEWSTIYYAMPKSKQAVAYEQLLNKTITFASQYPNKAEPLFWQAVTKATFADHQDAISALESIHGARDLLFKAITINPKTMNGSAYVTLGTLYYMAPKWPIAFGSNSKAQEYLEAALKINPNGIDSNYYYGDFLLSNDEYEKAAFYLTKAATAPPQPNESYSDIKLKEEAKRALKKAKNRKISHAKANFIF